MVNQLNPEALAIAQQTFQHFAAGLATAQWQPFLDMLTDDFTFWFPAGPFRGWNVGKDRAAEFFQAVAQIFDQGLSVTVQRTTQNDTTIVFEIQSSGVMLGQPYQNQAAIAFDVRGNQICGYREYLGVVFQLGAG
jgi:ketosteroid isomerase-like protein